LWFAIWLGNPVAPFFEAFFALVCWQALFALAMSSPLPEDLPLGFPGFTADAVLMLAPTGA
jgi:hypothetical protein